MLKSNVAFSRPWKPSLCPVIRPNKCDPLPFTRGGGPRLMCLPVDIALSKYTHLANKYIVFILSVPRLLLITPRLQVQSSSSNNIIIIIIISSSSSKFYFQQDATMIQEQRRLCISVLYTLEHCCTLQVTSEAVRLIKLADKECWNTGTKSTFFSPCWIHNIQNFSASGLLSTIR